MNVRLLRLYKAQNGKCMYCGGKCILSKNMNLLHDRLHLPNVATLEHKYSKVDIRRAVAPSDDTSFGMACYLCNSTLGKQTNYVNQLTLSRSDYNQTLFADLLNGLYDNKFII